MKTVLTLLTALAVLGCTAQLAKDMETSRETLEIVTFKIKPGISEKEAQAKLLALDACVSTFDGFIDRQLSQNGDGVWIDIVRWTDKASALKAAEKVMNLPEALDSYSVIDEPTIQMNHFTILHTFKN